MAAPSAITDAKNKAMAPDPEASPETQFGFNPDYSVTATPPDYMAVRRTIMDDPGLRLDFHWNEAKARQDASQIDTSRYTDAAVLPLIQADMQRNQQHIDYMRQQMDEFQQNLDHPYPIRKMAKFDTTDAIGLLASSLLGGGNIGHQAGQVAASNQATADNNYQNDVNGYNANQRRGEAIVAAANAELNRSLGYQNQLEGEQIAQTSHEADVKNSNVEKARQRFQTANTPIEVQSSADELAGYGVKLSPEEIAAGKADAGTRFEVQRHAMGQSEYNAIVQQQTTLGGFTPDQLPQIDAQIATINEKYGTHFAPPRGGPTERAKSDAAMAAFRNANLAAQQKHWEGELKTKNQQLLNQVAQWSADRQFRAQERAAHDDIVSRTALMKTNMDHVAAMTRSRDLTSAELDSKKKRLADIQGQLAAIKNNSALSYSDKKAQTKALYAQQSSLTSAIGNLGDDVNKYNQVLGQMQRASETDAGNGQQQQQAAATATTTGGQTRTYQGHQYRQDASGSWHLVN